MACIHKAISGIRVKIVGVRLYGQQRCIAVWYLWYAQGIQNERSFRTKGMSQCCAPPGGHLRSFV